MQVSPFREMELQRIADLIRIMPTGGEIALDVGTRDGHVAKRLVERFKAVTALDLAELSIAHPTIVCVRGNVTALPFKDNSFDLVVCTEVLEHISSEMLRKACNELVRVSRNHVLVGVPYKQDIRVGRTTCHSCGAHNPPWGHVNIFDEPRLVTLFDDVIVDTVSFAGKNNTSTNFVSTVLTDLAGNPYGTYEQVEPCIRCGARLSAPPSRTLMQKVLTKIGFRLAKATGLFIRSRPYWIHLLLRKQ